MSISSIGQTIGVFRLFLREDQDGVLADKLAEAMIEKGIDPEALNAKTASVESQLGIEETEEETAFVIRSQEIADLIIPILKKRFEDQRSSSKSSLHFSISEKTTYSQSSPPKESIKRTESEKTQVSHVSSAPSVTPVLNPVSASSWIDGLITKIEDNDGEDDNDEVRFMALYELRAALSERGFLLSSDISPHQTIARLDQVINEYNSRREDTNVQISAQSLRDKILELTKIT